MKSKRFITVVVLLLGLALTVGVLSGCASSKRNPCPAYSNIR